MNDRERIYREVLHEYHVEDAMDQVECYMECTGEALHEVDYDDLAARFELRRDSNVADNDTWQAVIYEYTVAKGMRR